MDECRRAAIRLATAALAALSIGCATIAGGPAPRELRAQADAALEKKQYEEAYRLLAEIHRRHPESRESDEVFPAAALLFKRQYNKNRFSNPTSPWVTSEPEFLFGWLATFYDGDAFPREQAEALLRGLELGFTRRFEAWASKDPKLAAWKLDVVEDNGIVQEITAERASAATR